MGRTRGNYLALVVLLMRWYLLCWHMQFSIICFQFYVIIWWRHILNDVIFWHSTSQTYNTRISLYKNITESYLIIGSKKESIYLCWKICILKNNNTNCSKPSRFPFLLWWKKKSFWKKNTFLENTDSGWCVRSSRSEMRCRIWYFECIYTNYTFMDLYPAIIH